MEKEFVPYELAVKLKALGFDEPCFGSWWFNPSIHKLNEEELQIVKSYYFGLPEYCILAPTFSQAFRWFREKYNLHAEITWSPSYEYDSGEWSDAIYEITITNVSYIKEWVAESPDMQRANGKQLTYEEAELACLDKLIELTFKSE